MEVSAGRGTIRPVSLKAKVAGRSSGRRPPSAVKGRRRRGRSGRSGWLGGYIEATRSVWISLVLTLPLLVIYNIGGLFPSSRMSNGLDLLTRLVGTNWGMYGLLVMNLVIGVASIVLAGVLLKKGSIRLSHWPMLVIEGVFWAFVLAFAGNYLADALNRSLLPTALPDWFTPRSSHTIGQILTASAGAGYWEELFFRLLLVGVPMWAAMRFAEKQKGGLAVKILFAVAIMGFSAVMFSLAHFLGGTEQPDNWSFLYRMVAGLLFGLLFLFRGLSTAAYTHFVYDVIVFWFAAK